MIRRLEAELKDVGDQALMRELAAAFPILRPGLFLSYCGRRPICLTTKRLTGIPPAVSRLRLRTSLRDQPLGSHTLVIIAG